MPKSLGDLRKAICAFTRRSPASFVSEHGDSLLVAVNNAKNFAQREVDFEAAFEQVVVRVAEISKGGDIRTAKIYPDETVAVEIKTVRKAFLQMTGNATMIPVPIVSRQSWVDSLERRVSGQVYSLNDRETGRIPNANAQATPLQIVMSGIHRFYVSPANEQVLNASQNLPIYFDAILQQQDFVSDNETSFLFTYGFDFMMFRSIYELNFLLKEDQRFAISMSILEGSWQSLKNWNSKTVGNTVTNTDLE
jgi:hypothetical protein